jgi:mannose-1-phosphate guanylyltransferase
MLDWLAGHGVDEAILSCGFLADSIREVLGDGGQFRVRLSYLEEPRPLGTGGAVKFAEDLLDERFLVLNGDVLTDIDLTAQLMAHERTGARLTLALHRAEDPSAYGLVRCARDGAIAEFIEKPGAEHVGAGLINAGVYVVERDILDRMGPAGATISIEREVFPGLISNGLYGFAASGYWLDIGTPERYLQATYDILDGAVRTAIGERLAREGSLIAGDLTLDGRIEPPAIIDHGCEIGAGAVVGARVVLGADVTVGADVRIEDAVLLEGARVGRGSTVSSSIIGPNATIGEHCHVQSAVLGEGAAVGSDSVLEPGARIFPGVRLPEGAIRS